METVRSEGFEIGVDLGQLRDYTAVAVLEKLTLTRETLEQPGFEPPAVKSQSRSQYHLRNLDRLPRGTEYPDVVGIVGRILANMPARDRCPNLIVDATGLGRPVVDMFRRAGLRPIAVTITGGNEETSPASSEFHVPKRNLVSTLEVLFQSDRLKIGRDRSETRTLVSELAHFRVRISAAGHDSYGAAESVHDDLVLATALAAWNGERKQTRARVIGRVLKTP